MQMSVTLTLESVVQKQRNQKQKHQQKKTVPIKSSGLEEERFANFQFYPTGKLCDNSALSIIYVANQRFPMFFLGKSATPRLQCRRLYCFVEKIRTTHQRNNKWRIKIYLRHIGRKTSDFKSRNTAGQTFSIQVSHRLRLMTKDGKKLITYSC